jgi:hypothetical protein
MAKHSLNTVQVSGLYQVITGSRPQGGNGAVDGGMARNDDDFGRFGLVQLTYELDALTVRQAEVCKQHIRALTPKLYPSVPDAMRPGNGKPFHARNFLKPVHDIRVIVDNQSMCHLILGNLVT